MSIAQATLQFVKEHRNDDVKALLLQASRYPDVDMRSAVQQIEGPQQFPGEKCPVVLPVCVSQ